MNDSSLPSNQSTGAQNLPIVRVQIPDVADPSSRHDFESTEELVEQNSNRIESLQQAIDAPVPPSSQTASAADHTNIRLASPADLQHLKYKAVDLAPKKVDHLIDSILQKFPLSHPVTIVFVSCKTDRETDKVSADVAQRLTERRVGKVLLVDSNPNSKSLTSNLGLSESAGIGNVVCDDQPWQNLLQAGATSGLDFLPYGNVNTAKTLRSRTAEFLEGTKEVYQFICVSVGLNESPIAKSFCNAADGIYLLIDLNQISHTEAKAAADKFKLNNQPLVGCIALDAEQETK